MPPPILSELLETFRPVAGEACYAVTLRSTCYRIGGGIELATLLDVLVRDVEADGGSRADITVFRVLYPPDTRELEVHRLLVAGGIVVNEETTPLLVPRDDDRH